MTKVTHPAVNNAIRNFNFNITFAALPNLVMEETPKKSRTLWYFLAFVSIAAMIAMFQFVPEWSWVTFPFVGTFVAGSMDVL